MTNKDFQDTYLFVLPALAQDTNKDSIVSNINFCFEHFFCILISSQKIADFQNTYLNMSPTMYKYALLGTKFFLSVRDRAKFFNLCVLYMALGNSKGIRTPYIIR